MEVVPIGVCSSFGAHDLVDGAELLALFDFLLVVLHHFPALVLPLQNLHSFSLELRLSSCLLLLPPHFLVVCEVLLKAL